MNLVQVAAPTSLVVSAAQAASHVRSVNADELADLEQKSRSAQQLVEVRMDRALTEQTLRLSMAKFPAVIKLPRSPVSSVTSVTYVSTSGVTTTLAVGAYVVDTDGEPGTIVPAYGTEWPATREQPGAVKVTYQAGHGAGRPAPPQADAAIKLIIGHFYENREAVVTGTISTEIDLAVDVLIDSSRIIAEYDQ